MKTLIRLARRMEFSGQPVCPELPWRPFSPGLLLLYWSPVYFPNETLMDYRFQYWLRTGLSGILLTLVICNIWINLDNIERQREVSARQSLILQAQQVDLPIYRALAQALVEVARKGDKQIEFLLAGEKISIAPQQSPGNQLPAGQGGSTPPNEGAEREGIRPGRPRGRP